MVKKSGLVKVLVENKYIDDYSEVSSQEVEEIKNISKEYKGLKVAHVNATAVGGGVAEMLKSIVPLQRSIGLDANWYVIPPDDGFFEVTKQIHNYLQGQKGDLSKKQQEIYIKHNQKIAKLLEDIESDVLIIHDPQPAASLSFIEEPRRPNACIWRCHIDTTRPNNDVWDFFRPFWQEYDHFVFTLKEYAHSEFEPDKLSYITPVIDPLSPKNKAMDRMEALKFLKKYGINTSKPFISQISRYDPWKDPLGVIDSFMMAKKDFPELQLVLAAQMADDDPEGLIMYEKVKEHASGKDDIFLIVNDEQNDLLINSLQTASTIVLQKSIREGFGLTVTEAMWKNNVVIGGNVGGIRLQIDDGINGFLVNNVEQAAEKIVYCLNNEKELKGIGEKAHQKVKNNFLTPHLILNYLKLISIIH